jgi:hypothetical protein
MSVPCGARSRAASRTSAPSCLYRHPQPYVVPIHSTRFQLFASSRRRAGRCGRGKREARRDQTAPEPRTSSTHHEHEQTRQASAHLQRCCRWQCADGRRCEAGAGVVVFRSRLLILLLRHRRRCAHAARPSSAADDDRSQAQGTLAGQWRQRCCTACSRAGVTRLVVALGHGIR